MRKIFVTGIDTNAGKTLVSAILCKALGADYWKPIQTGEESDSLQIQAWLPETRIHPEAFKLKKPSSPHEAAEAEGMAIELSMIHPPTALSSPLVIEGAGGLLVPLNYSETMADLIQKINAEVVLVSRNYLGSINHTLLSAELLKTRNIPVLGILFNGIENPASEKVILSMTGLKWLGRIGQENEISRETILNYAEQFRQI